MKSRKYKYPLSSTLRRIASSAVAGHRKVSATFIIRHWSYVLYTVYTIYVCMYTYYIINNGRKVCPESFHVLRPNTVYLVGSILSPFAFHSLCHLAIAIQTHSIVPIKFVKELLWIDNTAMLDMPSFYWHKRCEIAWQPMLGNAFINFVWTKCSISEPTNSISVTSNRWKKNCNSIPFSFELICQAHCRYTATIFIATINSIE